MKDDKFLHKYFGDQLQKQMDADQIDMMIEEQENDYPSKSIKKTLPAYELGDVFEYQALEQKLRVQRRTEMERRKNARIVQPDDPNKPKVITVMPND